MDYYDLKLRMDIVFLYLVVNCMITKFLSEGRGFIS
jgi:hypothetical protein